MKKVRLYEGFHNINEASKSQVYVAAKKGSYPATIVVVKNGKVVHQQHVDTPQEAPAAWSVIQGEYPNGKIHLEDKTGKILIREGVEVNEALSRSEVNKISDYLMGLDAEELMVICDELLIDDEEYQDIRYDLGKDDLVEYAMEYIEAEGIKLKDVKSIIESVEVNEGVWAFNKSKVKPFIKDLEAADNASDVKKLSDKYYNHIGDDLLYDALDRAIKHKDISSDDFQDAIADAIGRLREFIGESAVTESIQHGSYYFSKASTMIDNLLPAGGWKRGETKYAVICHNTVQMGKNVMYLKSANSNSAQNFEAHILSIHDTEEEAFSAYVETVKYDGGKTDTCVSYAYGTLDSKGSNYPFNEIGGERKVIK